MNASSVAQTVNKSQNSHRFLHFSECSLHVQNLPMMLGYSGWFLKSSWYVLYQETPSVNKPLSYNIKCTIAKGFIFVDQCKSLVIFTVSLWNFVRKIHQFQWQFLQMFRCQNKQQMVLLQYTCTVCCDTKKTLTLISITKSQMARQWFASSIIIKILVSKWMFCYFIVHQSLRKC